MLMNTNKKIFGTAIKYTIFAIILLMAIFAGVSLLWIAITPYRVEQFLLVLSLCIKNAGSYSVLLVGIVITIFFQVYSKEKEIEREDRIKIEEVGYYTLCFPRMEDGYSERFQGDKMVVEINDDNDYRFSPSSTGKIKIPIKFLTSKEKSTNLKNIMAFEEGYFKRHKRKILKKYYKCCEQITYASPLYCATKPTNELKNNKDADKSRYFWLFLNTAGDDSVETFWITGVTEEGILLLIKAKAEIKEVDEGIQIFLLQQTTYYKSNNKLCPLYR